MQQENFSLEEIVVTGATKEKSYCIEGCHFWLSEYVVDEQDTMFNGMFPSHVDWGRPLMAYLNRRISSCYYELHDMEQFLKTIRREPDPEVERQIQKIREEVKRLHGIPNKGLIQAAKAQGKSPAKFRKDQIRIYEAMIESFSQKNSPAYINQQLAKANKKLWAYKDEETRISREIRRGITQVKTYTCFFDGGRKVV